MTDATQAPAEAPADPRAEALAAATARYDAVMKPVMGLADWENVNGSILKSFANTMRAALIAFVVAPAEDAPQPDAPRDETHASIDVHGAPTPEATAAMQAMGVGSVNAADAKIAESLKPADDPPAGDGETDAKPSDPAPASPAPQTAPADPATADATAQA